MHVNSIAEHRSLENAHCRLTLLLSLSRGRSLHTVQQTGERIVLHITYCDRERDVPALERTLCRILPAGPLSAAEHLVRANVHICTHNRQPTQNAACNSRLNSMYRYPSVLSSKLSLSSGSASSGSLPAKRASLVSLCAKFLSTSCF